MDIVQAQLIYTILELWGGVFCIIGAICLYATRKLTEKGIELITTIMLLTAVLLFSDMLAWRFDRGTESFRVLFYIVDFLVLALQYAIFSLAIVYLAGLVSVRIGKPKKRMVHSANALLVISVGILIVSCFTEMYYWYDENGGYHIGKYINLHFALCILSILIMMVFVVRNRKAFYIWERIILFVIFILLILSYITEATDLLTFSPSNIAACVAMIIILIMHSIECAIASARQKEELDQAKRQMYLKQIQPHFVLNSLTSIKQACDDNDPQTAGRLVEKFADFLKGSLSSISNTECISITKEMQTVRSYMEIVNDRFEGDVKAVYDLQEVDFVVPPFSVQMLVENAVKHGIRKKPDGKGTVRIMTRREGAEYIVEVSDDGVGFDPEVLPSEGESRIGLKNVETRLRLMCNGRLEIESEPGSSTRAVMRIPEKQEARRAVSYS